MFRPMKPETIARRARERQQERLRELPGKIAAREAMAAKDSDPEWRAYWLQEAMTLRAELKGCA